MGQLNAQDMRCPGMRVGYNQRLPNSAEVVLRLGRGLEQVFTRRRLVELGRYRSCAQCLTICYHIPVAVNKRCLGDKIVRVSCVDLQERGVFESPAEERAGVYLPVS